MAASSRLEQLRAAWLGQVRSPVFWSCLWGLLLLLAVVSQLARVGTGSARLTSGLVLGGVLCALSVAAFREGRIWRQPKGIIRRVLFAVSRPLGERALRAQNLIDRAAERPGESVELARAHYEQLLTQATAEAVAGAAQKRARFWRAGWITAGLGTLLCALLIPLEVVEGSNVLLARHGRAPMRLGYLEEALVTAELPGYLRQARRTVVLPLGDSSLPEGSVVTIRATLRVTGRELVLTDGIEDVPLVSDGQGGVVAHWTVRDPAELQVAARFGDVKVFDPLELRVSSIPDREPIVMLEDAPRAEDLGSLERLELRFVASDDHGLDQIDLVLRSGRREERRPLVKLSGEERVHRAGHALTPDDAFLRRVFLPVEVTIEAKDNDTASGPKWGRSAPITLNPPPMGSREAARYEGLKAVRDALVELVAIDQTSQGLDVADRAGLWQKALDEVQEALKQSLEGRPGGLEVGQGPRHFLNAQVEALGDARKKRLAPDHALLAVDVLLGHLAQEEARGVAKRLGDVVEELGVRLRLMREDAEADGAAATMLLEFAEAGAGFLGQLGVLGRDLGSVAHADLGRIERLLKVRDLRRAELAARHLAARLRRPEPSFGSRGSSESSGMAGGGGRGGASPSGAPGEFDHLAEQIDELAGDHAQQMSELEQLLREAAAAAQSPEQRGDARARAEGLREAVAPLPEVGAEPGTPRAAAAEGRAHAEAMADGLERSDLDQTVESGRRALEALEEAARRRGDGYGSWLNAEDLEQARMRVLEELGQAERERNWQRERTRDALRGGLEERAGQQQQLARRAQELARRGRDAEAPLPGEITQRLEEASRLMREAARELGEGRGEQAYALQQEAQRRLEHSRTGRSRDADGSADEPTQDTGGDRGPMARDGDVPGARERNAAQAFRERLQKGLGQPSGRLAPAVRRYAESLQ